jgi:hypothetical protein
MGNDFLDNLQRRDLVSSLILWGVAEFVGLWLFPQLGLIRPSPEVFRTWVLRSLPLGIGGALLISLTSGMVRHSRDQVNPAKTLIAFLAGVGGWVGLVGIVYPLIVSCAEFFTNGLPE